MALEDISYLQKHGQRTSYMFFIDSSHRDKTTFPLPSTYQVQFSAPFKHVFGIQVLDASIPKTLFAVDDHNNVLLYSFTGQLVDAIAVTIDPGDYSDEQFISAFNAATLAIVTAALPTQDAQLLVSNKSNPGILQSTFVFSCSSTFYIHTNESTMRTVVGFDVDPQVSDLESGLYARSEYDTNVFKSFRNSSDANTVQDTIFFDTTSGTESSQAINGLGSEFVQPFSINSGDPVPIENLSSITIHIDSDNTEYADATTVELGIRLERNDAASNVNMLSGDTSEFYTTISIDVDTGYGTLHLNRVFSKLVTYGNYSIHVKNDNTFPVYIKTTTAGSYIGTPNHEGDVSLLDNLMTTLMYGNGTTSITAPGIYDLQGARYVILRCPEIEQHLNRSRSYERFTMGLAKFKLSGFGYEDTRLDFSSLPLREFFPIGKLTNMTFRFERPDGSVYNFRGLNHTITLAIHYFEPKQQGEFTQYDLNPHYNPDYFKSIQDDTSDSEEGFS